MAEDHLSDETSLSAELTDTGVKAAAKSRAVSAIDRLIGNVADLGNAWIEGVTTRRRAKNEGERSLIEAAAKYGVERMQAEDAFANRAFENHFRKIAGQQINRDAVAAEAIEDLSRNPPQDEESVVGPEQISEEFMQRFETYAEAATTDQLRERWGRILAGEIRKPGTFSPKVLRATDELEAETAALFESLQVYRVGDVLVKAIMPELSFHQKVALISSGLILDPGITGHLRFYGEGVFSGVPVWAAEFGDLVLSFPKSDYLGTKNDDVISTQDGKPTFSVLVLTDVGKALASILPSDENSVGVRYAEKLNTNFPELKYSLWLQNHRGMFEPISTKG